MGRSENLLVGQLIKRKVKSQAKSWEKTLIIGEHFKKVHVGAGAVA